MISDELTRIEKDAWASLVDATAPGANTPLRFVTLATVSSEGAPMVRLLVLRKACFERRMLEVHTDMRSQKWAELQTVKLVSVLGYDDAARIQLRLQGDAQLFSPGTPENEAAWASLSDWTRNTYAGGPPGDPLDDADLASSSTMQPDAVSGRPHFGVIRISVHSLDWVLLARGGNRRAFYEYAQDGRLLTGRWITP